MFPSMCNTGHALLLANARFSCCARRRAQLRVCITIRDGNAAIGIASNANRICKCSRQRRRFHFTTPCCVSAAWRDAYPLSRL